MNCGSQRRLALLDAREDAPQSLAREEDQIVKRAPGESATPVEHGSRIRSIPDRHQRAADHARSASLEQGREDFDLASLGHSDRAPGEG